MTHAVTEATFEQEVLKSEELVLVEFWAEWSEPCGAVAPVLDRIAKERNLKLVKVNLDEEQQLSARYGIQWVPNMILFENGAPKAQAVGAQTRSALERTLGLADRL